MNARTCFTRANHDSFIHSQTMVYWSMWDLQIGGVYMGLNSGGTRRLGERHFINLALYGHTILSQGHTILSQCQPGQGGVII